VLLRPKIRRRHRLSAPEVDVLLTDIAANGTVLETESPGGGIKGDDRLMRILDAASSALLVTGAWPRGYEAGPEWRARALSSSGWANR